MKTELLGRITVTNLPLIVVGIFLVYLMNRWDNTINDQLDAYKVEIRRGLEAGQRTRVVLDSLERLKDAAQARADTFGTRVRVLSGQVASLTQEFVEDSTASANSPIKDLLAGLKLRPIHRDLYGTDSVGVRFLENLRIGAVRGGLVPLLEAQTTQLGNQLSETQRALLLANEQVDTLEAQVASYEDILHQGEELGTCHIDPFGLIPCPSRTVAFVGGLVVGGAIMVVATR